MLIDTAGIRETADAVEQIGVQRAKAAVETADLILLVIDAAEPLSEEDTELLRSISGSRDPAEKGRTTAPILVLLNKNDLDTVITAAELEQLLEAHGILCDNAGTKEVPGNKGTSTDTSGSGQRTGRVLEISAATGEGKERLAEAVQGLFFAGKLSDSQEQYMLNARHKEALQDALDALMRVSDSVDAGVGEDFYTIDLLAAYEALGRITGETLEDDLADKIFREFCMGK